MSYRHPNQKTLYELRDDLVAMEKSGRGDYPVWAVTDRLYKISGVGSYRGYYEDAALEIHDIPGHSTITCSALIREISAMTEMEGYKGGIFPVHENTTLWLSRYGSFNPYIVARAVDLSVEDRHDRNEILIVGIRVEN